jgi:hypothetical protein
MRNSIGKQKSEADYFSNGSNSRPDCRLGRAAQRKIKTSLTRPSEWKRERSVTLRKISNTTQANGF